MDTKARWWTLVLGVWLVASMSLAGCGAPPPAAPQPTAMPTAVAVAEEAQQAAAVVEQSAAAQAQAPKLGITVTSDEEVTSPRTRRGGEFRGVGTSDAVSFHPYLTTDTASGSYQGLVYTGGLLRLDENTLEYIPNMAESYTISEDGLTFTFKLRETIR